MHELLLISNTEMDEDEGELSWQERALCAQTDPEAFFPEKGGSTREAKKVCVGVRGPVRVPRVRPGPRRAFRHLGRAVRARAPQAEEARRLVRTGSPRIVSDSCDSDRLALH